MMNWWIDLSRREQILVLTALVLFAASFVFFLLAVPLARWHGDSMQRMSVARDDYALVREAAASGAVTEPDPGRRVPLRQAVVSAAEKDRIELVRVGAEKDGRIEIRLGPADGDLLFSWLEKLEKERNISVVMADITQDETGDRLVARILLLEYAS